MNALQDWFDDDNDLPRSNDRERFDRGMFISINNHKQGNDDLYGSLKKQYQSLIYALTGSNPSRDQIKVTDKLPAQRTILQLMAKKRVVVAAALHTYDAYNQKTGRGSRYNFGGYNHLHFYAFGLHHLMQQHKGGVDAAVRSTLDIVCIGTIDLLMPPNPTILILEKLVLVNINIMMW